MVEHNGFYRAVDQAWVKLERIQFVGACNPPTDPGRKPLTHRYTFTTLIWCLGLLGLLYMHSCEDAILLFIVLYSWVSHDVTYLSGGQL